MTSCEIGVLQNNPLEAGHDPKTLAEWYRRPILKGDAEAYFKISTNPSSATLP
jgi:hypothetical protein